MKPASASSSRVEARELRTPDELAAAADEWAALARDASEPNPFFEPWMAVPAARHLTGDADVRWLAVRDQQLLGVVPVERRPASPAMPLPRWRVWRHPYCFLCTPLVRAGVERTFWRGALDWLEAHARIAGPVEMPWQSDGPVAAALRRELEARGRPARIARRWERAALVANGASAADYVERAVRKKKRKELRRQRARLSDEGELELRVFDAGAGAGRAAPDDVADFVHRFCALETAGWKGDERTAMASRVADRQFLDETVAGAAAAGALLALELVLDGRAVASKIVFRSGDTSFMFKIAYDEQFARFSPGVLLELDFLECALDRLGLQAVDSCAAPDHPMIDHLWSERRSLQSLSAAAGPTGSLVLRARPLVRHLRQRLSAVRRGR